MPEQPDPAAAKTALRKGLLATRAARSAADRDTASAGLARTIAANAERLRGRVLAAYVPTADEPGDGGLLDLLVANGVRVLLPITSSMREPLTWGWYDGPDGLVSGPGGLRQPAIADPAAGPTSADWVAVPALAVDRRGHRLGRGAGHYDRALATESADRLIAVVYDDEVLEELPAEYHDRPVGWVVSPSDGIRRLRAAGRYIAQTDGRPQPRVG